MVYQVDSFFGTDGILARALPGYEVRDGQLDLARAIELAFVANRHLLAEAPCGVGKSLAYLVPAILHARATGGKVVIATANIALQEQLVTKDLPFLAAHMPTPFTFALLKGKNNYLCAERYINAEEVGGLNKYPEAQKILREWVGATETGDKSELEKAIPDDVWRMICGHREECCDISGPPKRVASEDGEAKGLPLPRCFYEQAKMEAAKADVLVCNYHLLFADAVVRASTNDFAGVLPPFTHLVMDEAHEAPDIAREFFGWEITEVTLTRLADRVDTWHQSAYADRLRTAARKLFRDLQSLMESPSYKARLRTPGTFDPTDLCSLLDRYEHRAEEHIQRSGATGRDEFLVRSAIRRAGQCAEYLRHAAALDPGDWVYWLDTKQGARSTYTVFRGAPINSGAMIRATVYDKRKSVVALSATMIVDRTFKFMERELGTPEHEELTALSPFRFDKQARIIVPCMECAPNEIGFINEAIIYLSGAMDEADGRTLALFPSRKNCAAAAQALVGRKHRILVQGEGVSRLKLIEEFRRDINSCLFGVASFWTGVDIQGESLSCLVIDKLPFPVPDDPIIDYLNANDPDCFWNQSIPRAVITFRQGVGRLIRTQTDRGVIVVLDKRIIEKSYGRTFLNSIPSMRLFRDVGVIRGFLATI